MSPTSFRCTSGHVRCASWTRCHATRWARSSRSSCCPTVELWRACGVVRLMRRVAASTTDQLAKVVELTPKAIEPVTDQPAVKCTEASRAADTQHVASFPVERDREPSPTVVTVYRCSRTVSGHHE